MIWWLLTPSGHDSKVGPKPKISVSYIFWIIKLFIIPHHFFGPIFFFKFFDAEQIFDAKSFSITGGEDESLSYSETWIIDLDTEEWSSGPSMIEKRAAHGCAMLDSGLIVAAGGHPLCKIWQPTS